MADAFIHAVRCRLHPELAQQEPSNDARRPRASKNSKRALPKPSDESCEIASSSKDAPLSSHSHQKLSTDPQHSNSQLPPPAKRQKQSQKDTSERGVRYRAHPSKAVLDRYTRSLRHRLFLVHRHDASATEATFSVMGANGNIYRCRIATDLQCNCPDFVKRADTSARSVCKHLIFLFMRVLRVDKENPVWWQSKLTKDEVKKVLEAAPSLNQVDCLAEQTVLDAFSRQRTSGVSSDGSGAGRRPIAGDCPICFEDMAETDETRPEDVTTWCRTCGNSFHKTCLQNCIRAGNKNCPLCRATIEGAQQVLTTEFTNLAQFSTTHARTLTLAELYRDTHRYIRQRER